MEKYEDKNLPLKERKKEFEKVIDKMMNPITEKDFNPDDFDVWKGTPEYECGKRKRVLPPKELPTYGLKPKEIRVGQMVGEYESKQDLYLIFAYRTNELQKEVNELKARVEKLEKKR